MGEGFDHAEGKPPHIGYQGYGGAFMIARSCSGAWPMSRLPTPSSMESC
jgi:hypothetical protein